MHERLPQMELTPCHAMQCNAMLHSLPPPTILLLEKRNYKPKKENLGQRDMTVRNVGEVAK
ncbi:unnamed protein product [Sphenostylis stenocarpa]|uniref:Uncharacterized protein n=1 Tax=Sphenostylis stenocarpa TaxID=92480 RepID=A0AA86S523_9FABA|nr:unnamed protein product [Sphenostylis stenocarpa]